MTSRTLRIVMDGATGEIGANQHLIRSVLAIRGDGGLVCSDGVRVVPEPVLLGRNADKLAALARAHGDLEWSTDRGACLKDPFNDIYFDASATAGRVQRALQAIAAGKHILLEKPIASSLEEAMTLAAAAAAAGVRTGVVQDKIHLPGLLKMQSVLRSGLLGRLLSVRLDFGWWIFDGDVAAGQRGSWNFRKGDGGGLVLDMFPHWRYIIETLFGPIRAVSCRVATRIPQRWKESGEPFKVDVEDEAFATLELEGGIHAQINSSWVTRVRRDDLLTIQVDGSQGSATCTLHDCFLQPLAATPRPRWDVDVRQDNGNFSHWQAVPDAGPYTNSYRRCWELFLRHVVDGDTFYAPLLAGARGLQLIDAAYRSNMERRWIDLPELSA